MEKSKKERYGVHKRDVEEWLEQRKVDSEKRYKELLKQIEDYGFCEYDTFSLDSSMMDILSDRLEMFLDKSDHVDWTDAYVQIEGLSENVIILWQEMLNIRNRLRDEDNDNAITFGTPEWLEAVKRFWFIWYKTCCQCWS